MADGSSTRKSTGIIGQESFRCKICGNGADNTTHVVREMMFKTGEEFIYVKCGQCGTLQLQNPPHEMARYYPPEYYSLGEPLLRKDNPLKAFVRHQRARYLLTGNGVGGRMVAKRIGTPPYFQWLRKLFEHYSISFQSRIVDIGCGSGDLLLCMQKDGYSKLVGVDPFTAKDFKFGSLEILKREIFDLGGTFDCAMMHHALEHVPDPSKTMRHIHHLLRPAGGALIRIPIFSEPVWKEYYTDWFGFEAPRHFYIFTVKAFTDLAQQAGFAIKEIVYDSGSFTLYGSEQNRRNISIMDERSYFVNPNKSIFSNQQMLEFQKKAEMMNEDKQGDMAAFYLTKM